MIRTTMSIFARFGAMAAGVGMLVLLSSAPASAQLYDFTFTSSSGMDATGTIDISGGVADFGSINVTGVPIEHSPGFVTASGSLLPGTGSAQNHNGDNLPYDNLVTFANNPILTGNGIDFVSGQYDGTHYDTLIGLWGGDAGGNPIPDVYTLFVGLASFKPNGDLDDPEYVYAYFPGTLILTPVPEPSTVVLVFSALVVGLAAIRRRGRA
jgi:hypothetical protein